MINRNVAKTVSYRINVISDVYEYIHSIYRIVFIPRVLWYYMQRPDLGMYPRGQSKQSQTGK